MADEEIETTAGEETSTTEGNEEKSDKKNSKNRLVEGVEDVFEGITSNIELILGTIVAIVLQAISTILSGKSAGTYMNFSLLLTVIEFVIGPFIMLIVFKIVNEKINDKMKKISDKYTKCAIDLEDKKKELREKDFMHKITMEKEQAKHELELERMRYDKDIEIAQLNTSLKAKNVEISSVRAENDRLKSELKLRTNS